MRKAIIRKRLSFAGAVACALCYPGISHAADNWQGGVTTGDSWNVTGNWSAGTVPLWNGADPAIIDSGQASIATFNASNVAGGILPGVVFVGNTNTGSLLVSGGQLEPRTVLDVGEGNGSFGTLNQSGGTVGTVNVTVGDQAGSNGTYLLSNASAGSATLTTGGGNNLIIGNAGTGLLNIISAGTTVTPAFLYVGNSNGGNGTVLMNGGSVTLSNQGLIGQGNGSSGVFNQSGGSVNGPLVIIGNLAGSNGTYNLDGTTASASLLSGTQPFLIVGNFSTGVLNVRGASAQATPPFLYVGASNGSNGTLQVSGGTVSVRSAMYVGALNGSTGTVNQSGGTVNNAIGGGYPLSIGDQFGSHGSYYLSGGSLTNTTGQTTYVGNNGAGLFNISGSVTGTTFTTGTLLVGNASTGTLQVSGGVITTNSLLAVGESNLSAGTVVQTAGVIKAGGNNGLIIGDKQGSTGSYFISGTGQLNFSNNSPTPIIGNGGTGLLDIESSLTGLSSPFVESGTTAGLIVGNTSTGVGTLQGYFTSLGSGALTNNGKIIADGHGSANTLNLSSFNNNGLNFGSQAIQQTQNIAGAGWYAKNKGKLTLSQVTVTNGNIPYEWGDTQGTNLSNTSLVNSVQANFSNMLFFGPDMPLNISLLAPDRSEVTLGNTLPASTSFIGVWDIATNNVNTAGPPSVSFVFRYDNVSAGALTPALFELIGTIWTPQPDIVNGGLLSSVNPYNPANFGGAGLLFAIGVTSGPASGSSTWNVSSGTWETGGNWLNNTIPNAAGQTATFADSTGTSPATVTLGSETVGAVAFTGFMGGSYTIASNGGGGSALTLNNNSSTAAITVNAGNQSITAPIILTNGVNVTVSPAGTLLIGGAVSGTGTFTATTNSTVAVSANGSIGVPLVVGGNLIFQASGSSPILVRSVPSLNINSGTVTLASAGSISARQLLSLGSLSVTGKLDLVNNDLDVANGNLTNIQNAVIAGYNNGAWNGASGIVSSTVAADTTHLTALGVIQNSLNQSGGAILKATFDTHSVSNLDVLVKYTFYGDADLSGNVDGTDYSRIDSTYLQEQNTSTQISGWFNGDFNYDGVVDGSDYTLIDNAYNSQGVSLASAIASPTAQIAGTSSVPEPTSLGLVGISAVGMLGRRRRR